MSTKVSVSFRIWHPSIDPKRISNALAINPRHSWMSGDVMQTKSGKSGSYWAVPLESNGTRDLVAIISAFCESHLGPAKALLHEIHSTGGKSEIYLTWYVDGHHGEVLSWKVVKMLGECQTDLALEFVLNELPSKS